MNSVEEFRPIARRIRTARRVIRAAAFGAPVVLFASAFLRDTPFVWLLPLAAATGFAVALVLVASGPRFRCIVCHSHLSAKGDYCPQCGAAAIAEGGGWLGRHCKACGTNLRYLGKGGGRSYRICYCGHCGSHLDVEGL